MLGLPLARPLHRLLAMGIDGILVAILVKSGATVLGLSAALILFRASQRDARQGGFVKRSVRMGLRIAGAVVLFVVVAKGFDNLQDRFSRKDSGDQAAQTQDGGDAVRSADDSAAVFDASTDSLASQVDTLRAELRQLRNANDHLSRQNEKLTNDLAEAEKPHGIRSFLTNALDDLGVGFGWLAVYFTAFLAMWRGQTPGKRLLGIRVLRLDGQPLGWWLSFERFGGYAASASVGLLGFAQILWDKNRQGLHDKACETIVVREMPKTIS